jgi:RHH-type proline utilization regulon transcriptional repressor/proline dehydrogenase/delta 1-pyrroline-5-carboxylate dehydrogenase
MAGEASARMVGGAYHPVMSTEPLGVEVGGEVEAGQVGTGGVTAGLVDTAVDTARQLLEAARRQQRYWERRSSQRLASLLEGDEGRDLTLALADGLMRIRDPGRAAQRLADIVASVGPFPQLGALDRRLLGVGAAKALAFPRLVMPLVKARLRLETWGVIGPAESKALSLRLRRRERSGIAVNLNLLGEAVLGDAEADRRLSQVVELARRPDVHYVSVKVSSLCAQLSTVAFDAEVDRVVDRLRTLLLATRGPGGAFVYLDMEEYRDLRLTAAAFRRVLDEPDLIDIDAGIALQAYLPDSNAVLEELCCWAVRRHERGGGHVRFRLVKGANLAMEAVEAELHGWPCATYTSKEEVDANYKRLLGRLLDDDRLGPGIRVGVGSHNLFDVAWGLTLRGRLADPSRVEIEMLEGMAPAQARAVRDAAGSLLVYLPVVRNAEFDAAVAYLARRLDENTQAGNFLRELHTLSPGSAAWIEQERRFRKAVASISQVSTEPRRRPRSAAPVTTDAAATGDNGAPVSRVPPFANQPDTDWAVPENRLWLQSELVAWQRAHPWGVELALTPTSGAVRYVDSPDPSRPSRRSSNHPIAGSAAVEEAVTVARTAAVNWMATSPQKRRLVLDNVARTIEARRGQLIAAMMSDAGKVVTEADAEVSEAVDFARYYGQSTLTIEALAADGMAFDPYPVVVVAPPWNFPLSIPAGGVLAALAAGSAVILKPAPQTVLTAHLLAECCWEGGVPLDTLQVVPCADGAVGRRLVTHEGVDAVILTGSWGTAGRFLRWLPDMRLHAETSGKNAIVVTATADIDEAVRDIAHSAFSHSGQKCSAASLAIVEASVHDDARFVDKLRDAVSSMRVGSAYDLTTAISPLIEPPGDVLLRALTTLDDGESWLVEPRQSADNPQLWSPGVRMGVTPRSWFYRTECFGPVLGVVRVEDLDEALNVQNGVDYGLTAGLHSLDPAEIDRWLSRVQAGNLYVNRHITGAIVARQPFGGWKRSSVGATAKAGGPNYVLSLGRWRRATGSPPSLGVARASFATAWQDLFGRELDVSGLVSEANLLRYRPLDWVLMRAGADVADETLAVALLAAARAGARVQLSVGRAVPVDELDVVVETDAELAARLGRLGPAGGEDMDGGFVPDRLRLLGLVDLGVRRAANAASISVDDSPVVDHGRIELLRWMKEQAISRTLHRHGNLSALRW